MEYTNKNLSEARKLFLTPLEAGLYHSTCGYCGKPALAVYRLKGEEKFKHSDCFVLDYLEQLSKLGGITPIDASYQIEHVDSPKVLIKEKTLKKLIDKSVGFFPQQHMFLLVCNEENDEIRIEDFVDNPLFTYNSPEGKFSEWELDLSCKAVKKFKKIISTKPIGGYIHSHDTNYIGLSDLYYDAIYSRFAGSEDGIFIRGQLDIFAPTLKELVLLNHEKFNGRQPIAKFQWTYIRPTVNFNKYTKPSKENKKIVEKAKTLAKKEIASNISRYFSVYSSILDEFKDIKIDEINEMFEELGPDKDISDEKKIADITSSKLIKKIKGKIKEFPVSIVK